jgi:hypothetical protein
MTITVSVEELREYQDKCHKWYEGRIKNTGRVEYNHSAMAPIFTVDMKALEQYDATHPFPKLIPSI